MSLLTTASPWTSSAMESKELKKKTPSIRKTIKKINSSPEMDEEPAEEEARMSKVTDMLQQMSSTIHMENVGEGLTNFQPLSYPELDPPPPPAPALQRPPSNTSHFSANPPPLERTGDYRQVYQPPPHLLQSSYGKPMNNLSSTDRVWDRLGYIVHLLEEQQNERTEHVMEEYILYVLLGTFVIFVVDSFSRGGKYVR